MPRTSPKLAITVAPDVYDGIKEQAEREGVSVSAWVTEAARDRLKIIEGLAAVAEWEAEHGALSEDELARADAELAEAKAALAHLQQPRSA
ncbi:MAG: hypothetical protein J2O46_03680 [Nocardioides sp.]|nr:hypothetical protein [Nocardioides sp.]